MEIIKVKYKGMPEFDLFVYGDNDQLNAIIRTLHLDQVNIEYYKAFLKD